MHKSTPRHSIGFDNIDMHVVLRLLGGVVCVIVMLQGCRKVGGSRTEGVESTVCLWRGNGMGPWLRCWKGRQTAPRTQVRLCYYTNLYSSSSIYIGSMIDLNLGCGVWCGPDAAFEQSLVSWCRVSSLCSSRQAIERGTTAAAAHRAAACS